MYPLFIQTIAEDRVKEMHEQATRDRQVRLARQRSSKLRRTETARIPIALRVLPQSIRPRFS
jgi:hypothetical protein